MIEGELPHFDVAAFSRMRRPGSRLPFTWAAILNLADDVEMTLGNTLAKIGFRPPLECFRQQGVIGDIPRQDRGPISMALRHRQCRMLVDKQAHKLRPGDCRMGVIELDRNPVCTYHAVSLPSSEIEAAQDMSRIEAAVKKYSCLSRSSFPDICCVVRIKNPARSYLRKRSPVRICREVSHRG